MDVHSYISSGIIETYVAGLATPQEQQELEEAALHNPLIKAAVTATQQDMERYVQLYAILPPDDIRSRISDVLHSENTEDGRQRLPEELRPVVKPAAIPVEQKKSLLKKTTDNRWRYIAAAIILLLGGSVALNFFLARSGNEYEQRYKQLVTAQEELKKNKEVYETRYAAKDLELIKDPAFRWVKLEGTTAHSEQLALVCWNPQTGTAYMIAQFMPAPPAGKQFQLWAVVNGTPVNAGVFETGQAVSRQLQLMLPITAASRFIVTLENKGGSGRPTLSDIHVAGNVNN